MSDKWVLEHGIHRGTLTSRDVGQPKEFNSRSDAMKAFEGRRKFYQSIGYQIWFAYLISPDGTRELLEQNPYW